MEGFVDAIREAAKIENCVTLLKISNETKIAFNMKTIVRSFIRTHFDERKSSFTDNDELITLLEEEEKFSDVVVLCSTEFCSTFNYTLALVNLLDNSCEKRHNWF